MRFVPNPLAGKELALAPEMTVFLLARAEEVAQVARSIGPTDDDADPHYVEAISAEAEPGRARVNANKFTSAWIEFGTGEPGPTSAFHVLSRAAEAVGLRVTGGRR